MLITGEQLLTLADSEVLAALSKQKLAPVGAYRVSRLAAIVFPEAQRIRAARNQLLTAENSIEISPGMLQLKPEHAAEFTAALKPLLEETITLVDLKPVTLADLAGALLSPVEIGALGPLVTE